MRKPHLTRRVRAGLNQMIDLARQQIVDDGGDLNTRIKQDNLRAAIAWAEARITGANSNDDAEELSDGTGR